MKQQHLYLIDGSGYIFRAYYRLPPMTNPEGVPVNAVYGFTTMLWKLIDDLRDAEHPTHMAVIFDSARRCFRNDIYPDYKANRPETPEDLIPQFSLIRDSTQAFDIPAIELSGFEADDLIASYARRATERGWEVTIVSSDKDLMQLIRPGVRLFDPMKNKSLGESDVLEKFGVSPDKVIEVQSLIGDSVDNVPGVPGIGPKIASELIRNFGNLEGLLAEAPKIKQNKRRENLIVYADQARMSRQLVILKDDIDPPQDLDDLTLPKKQGPGLADFLQKHAFKSLLTKLERDGRDSVTKTGVSADPRTDFDHQSYVCIQSLEALQLWIDRAWAQHAVAIDTETTGLDVLQDRLVGISLGLGPNDACYIPLNHGSSEDLLEERPPQIPIDEAIAALKPILEDPSVMKIGQNIKFDVQILKGQGITMAPADDTMLMSYALDSGRNSHGMDVLSALHLQHKPISYHEVVGKGRQQKSFAQVPLDQATPYAAEDADITWRLATHLKPRLVSEKMLTLYERLERPMIAVCTTMERHGVLVDGAYLGQLSHSFEQRMQRLEEQIHAEAGKSFNVASPKQLGEILFDHLGLQGGRRGKTGAWSTDSDVLERLASEGVPLALLVLDWRGLAKLKSTYTDALQKAINPNTGRVHTSYSLASTSTGRIASNNPNLQNIPIRTEEGRKIRKAFIASPGHKLISADYSQMELRLLAVIANVEELQQAFKDHVDIHAMTASEIFDIPMDRMTPEVRRRAKAINFGIIYGISAFGLGAQLNISRREAQDIIDRYFLRFPGIRDYMNRTIRECQKCGFVTTITRRKVHLPMINSKRPRERQFAERAAINAPIQGSAADIMRRAMISLHESLINDERWSRIRMLLQVHDELVFEVPDDLTDAFASFVAREMAEAAHGVMPLDLPMLVDSGVGQNWGEAH